MITSHYLLINGRGYIGLYQKHQLDQIRVRGLQNASQS